MSRCRSFLPDLMTVRAVMVRAAMEEKKTKKTAALLGAYQWYRALLTKVLH